MPSTLQRACLAQANSVAGVEDAKGAEEASVVGGAGVDIVLVVEEVPSAALGYLNKVCSAFRVFKIYLLAFVVYFCLEIS
jgi:hypothetical protein